MRDGDHVRLVKMRARGKIGRWRECPFAPSSSLVWSDGADVNERPSRTVETHVRAELVSRIASEIGDEPFEVAMSGSASLGRQRQPEPLPGVLGCSPKAGVPSIALLGRNEADFAEGDQRMACKAKRCVLVGTGMAVDLHQLLAEIVVRAASHVRRRPRTGRLHSWPTTCLRLPALSA
jgi:hypothetical protein